MTTPSAPAAGWRAAFPPARRLGSYQGAWLPLEGLARPAGSSVGEGATLYYQHKWAPEWVTVAGASTLWISDDGQLRRPDELRRVVYASANLIHRLTPTLIVGGEVPWGEATRVDGTSATNTRVQLSVRHLIF